MSIGERYRSPQASALDRGCRAHASGPFLLTQARSPRLADGARVATISSGIGSIGLNHAFRTPHYAIGKAAQNRVRAVRARGAGLVALHPGWVRADMGGEQAALSAQDSVAGLLRVIAVLGAGDSGAFLDWRGQTLSW